MGLGSTRDLNIFSGSLTTPDRVMQAFYRFGEVLEEFDVERTHATGCGQADKRRDDATYL